MKKPLSPILFSIIGAALAVGLGVRSFGVIRICRGKISVWLSLLSACNTTGMEPSGHFAWVVNCPYTDSLGLTTSASMILSLLFALTRKKRKTPLLLHQWRIIHLASLLRYWMHWKRNNCRSLPNSSHFQKISLQTQQTVSKDQADLRLNVSHLLTVAARYDVRSVSVYRK